MNLEEWLNTPCKPEEIAYLDEEKTIAYIPIGIIESIWDEIYMLPPDLYYSWSINNFKFSTFKSVNTTFASGSVEIEIYAVSDGVAVPIMKRIGAATIPIFTSDENKDYEGTVLSLAVSNASKKFGRRFGRHLNGRMEVGETAVKIDRTEEKPESREDRRWKQMFDNCQTLQELGAFKGKFPEYLKDYYNKRIKELEPSLTNKNQN